MINQCGKGLGKNIICDNNNNDDGGGHGDDDNTVALVFSFLHEEMRDVFLLNLLK